MSVEQPEDESPRPEFSLQSIARAIWKRRLSITVSWILLLACTVAIVWNLPTVYSAHAVILVDSQKIPEKFVTATVAANLQERIATIRQQIMSSSRLKKIIDDFGLYRNERKDHVEEEILDMMRNDITISIEKDTLGGNKTNQPAAFRIGYQGSNPVLVADVANRLTTFYIDENLKTREVQAEGTSDFLQVQVQEAKKRLDELEATVSSYKLQHNGELPEQQQSLGVALARLQVELEANRDGINRAQQTRIILENSLNSAELSLAALTRALTPAAPASGSGDTSLAAIRANQPVAVPKKAAILQEQLDLLRTRYREDHPDVIQLRAALENVKRDEERERAAATEPEQDGAKAAPSQPRPAVVASTRDVQELLHAREQVANLKAQVKVAEKDLTDRLAGQERILRESRAAQSRLERLPVREQEMSGITRDYEISKANYRALLDKKLAAEMALDMERRQKSERFTILDSAKVPERPIKPKRPLLYALGSAGSLVLALLFGFIREARQNVNLGEWELPPDTAILARLPYIVIPAAAVPDEPGTPSGRRRRLAGLSAALVSVIGLTVAGLYFFYRF